jgi:ribonuclease Z
MEVTFLGTSCMIPTKERNLFSVFIRHETEGILVDCGEGTQRQFSHADMNLVKITKILITHWHGDHILGLPGLVQTLGASHYNGKLMIFGPKGSKKFFDNMKKSFFFDIKIDVEVKDITKNGKVFENNTIRIDAEKLEHGVPCIGYRIIEPDKRKINMKKVNAIGMSEGPLLGQLQDNKSVMFKGKKIHPDDVSNVEIGRKIAVVVDTVPCNGAVKLARDADLLIAESTYASDLEEKGEQHGHMTSQQAAQMAQMANVKELVLTHFSRRYKTSDVLLEDAKKIFPNVKCAYDLMNVRV